MTMTDLKAGPPLPFASVAIGIKSSKVAAGNRKFGDSLNCDCSHSIKGFCEKLVANI